LDPVVRQGLDISMKTTQVVVASLGIFTSAFVAHEGLARTQPVFVGGRPQNAADAACFADDAGSTGIKNICNAPKNYGMYIPVDTSGSKNMMVRAAGTVTSCTYLAYDATGSIISFAALSTTAFSPITVPAASFSYVVCTLGATSSGRLVGIDFNNP
jgi:hypothetical protein